MATADHGFVSKKNGSTASGSSTKDGGTAETAASKSSQLKTDAAAEDDTTKYVVPYLMAALSQKRDCGNLSVVS